MSIDKATAVRLAKVCEWVYDFDASRESELLEHEGTAPHKKIVISDDAKAKTSFAGIIEYADVVIVAFQGTRTDFGINGVFATASIKDWIQNFQFRQVDSSATGLPGCVHKGFFGQLDAIYGYLKGALQPLTAKPLLLTGHSQGGAVAALATKRLHQDGISAQATYTFAAPRCGDSEFADSVTTPVYRVEYGNDIVPHMPPKATEDAPQDDDGGLLTSLFSRARDKQNAVFGYAAVGSLTYQVPGGPLQTDLSAADESTLYEQRKRELRKAGNTLVEHHGIANYIGMFA